MKKSFLSNEHLSVVSHLIPVQFCASSIYGFADLWEDEIKAAINEDPLPLFVKRYWGLPL